MHPGLYLNYLKYFYDAATAQSISKAAAKNFVTQSAISQGIIKLEKALQVTLTSHQKHKFKLTIEGEIVFKKAKEVFNLLIDMQESLNDAKAIVKGFVKIACPPSIAMSFIHPLIQKMKKKFPELEIQLNIASPNIIVSQLKDETADFGIILGTPQFNEYRQKTLHQGAFNLYAKSILRKVPHQIIVDSKNGINVDCLKEYYRKTYKRELTFLEELGSWEVVARFVEEGLYTGFLPDYLMLNKRHPSIRPIKTRLPAIPYEVIVIYPKDIKLSRAAQHFIDAI